MELFNLTTAEHAISNIVRHRIKISQIDDLNDPFELLAINVGDKELRAAARLTRDQITETRGVICFSKHWSNPVLWSHYADKHRGIALGFEVADRFVMPVRYEKSLRKVKIEEILNKSEADEDFGRLLLATKFEDWRYEEEFRIFVDLTRHKPEDGLYFCTFDEHLVLTSVILGARCEIPIKQIEDLVAAYPTRVRVRKARLAFTKFGVTENLLYRKKA